MWTALLKILHWGLDILYPRDCFFCQQPAGAHGHICPTCIERLAHPRNPSCSVCGAESQTPGGPDFICTECLRKHPAFERAVIATRYDAAMRDLVHCFKYRAGLWLTEDINLFMLATYITAFQDKGITIDLLVPIPMTWRKQCRRGYNQAAILARALAQSTGIPCAPRLLTRRDTGIRSQTRLTRTERFRNALAAYHIRHAAPLWGKTILLIDDVMTTGATFNACAKQLRAAGAKTVYALAFARGTTT